MLPAFTHQIGYPWATRREGNPSGFTSLSHLPCEGEAQLHRLPYNREAVPKGPREFPFKTCQWMRSDARTTSNSECLHSQSEAYGRAYP